MAKVSLLTNIQNLRNFIGSPEDNGEPNMEEFITFLIEYSNLTEDKKKIVSPPLSEVYALRFGSSKCPDRSGTAMWRLFKVVFYKVIAKHVVCNEYQENELLRSLMGIGNFCHQQKDRGLWYDNHTEFERLTELLERYDGRFKEECKAAYDEIKSRYKAA